MKFAKAAAKNGIMVADESATQRNEQVELAKAQEAIAARDEFLSILSHELRTPITTLTLGIQNLTRLANEGELHNYPREKLLRLLQITNDQNQRLSDLVNNLLDVTRIRAGRLVLQLKEIDLSLLVKKVVAELSESLKIASCPIELELEDGIIGRWDCLRLEQVIVNLLTNAIKYAPGNPIHIRTQKHENSARLLIKDHGIGIPKAEHQRIFNRFERAHTGHNLGGIGLGLYIVRQILTAHGGQICIDSEPGQGALFTIEIPLRIDASEVLQPERLALRP